MKKSQVILRVIVVIGILVVVNLISDKLHFRLDFTEDGRYTLSNATKDVLKDVDDIITIKAYFSGDLPPQLMNTKRDFEDFLVEYESRSDGNIAFEFINPNESEELEREAQQNGIAPLIVNVNENDKVVQMRAYMGAILQLGEEKEVIPQIRPGAAMEFALTTSIKKLSVKDKPKVGVLAGHGEPGMQEIAQLGQQLEVLYTLEPVNLKEVSSIGPEYKSLIWVNPTDTVDNNNFSKLDDYLSLGGKIMLAYNTVEGDLSQGALTRKPKIGIESWLASKGIEMDDQFVIDAKCSPVQVREQTGFMTMVRSIEFPYFPIVTSFEDHPVVAGLEQLVLPFVNAISFSGKDSTMTFQPLLRTSENSGFQSAPTYIDIQRRWREADFTAGSQVIAAAVSNVEGAGKMVIINNGKFIINPLNQGQPQPIQPENVNLASNAVDWLSDDTGLIELRTKGVTARSLKTIEDGARQTYKIANAIVPVVLVLLYGFIRRQKNLRKRQSWAQGNI